MPTRLQEGEENIPGGSSNNTCGKIQILDMHVTQVLSSGVTCELKGLELVMCPNVAFSSSRFHQL